MSEKHFYEQRIHTASYLIPFLQHHLPDFRDLRILEVGCAEGGFLDVLYDIGAVNAMGLELEAERARIAEEKNPMLKILVGDITDDGIARQIGDPFDLVVMRDVIEHIPDRMAAFSTLSRLVKGNGHLYITFPPRFSAFAGHQQNGRSILRLMPYLHLLPKGMIRMLGKCFKERPSLIETVILNYRTGLSIHSFEMYCSMFHFEPIVKELFLLRPIYRTRFGLTPKRAPNIPFIRELIASGCECLLKKAGRPA